MSRLKWTLTRSAVWLGLLLVSWLGLVKPALAQDGNAIESVMTSAQGAVTLVRIQMRQPLSAVPPSFAVSSPPRIAVDFVDTANVTGKTVMETAQGEVRSVNIVQAGNRSRVVLNLKRATTYTAAVDGRNLTLTIEPVSTTANASSGSTITGQAPGGGTAVYSFSKGDSNGQHALRDIDFRRGKDGEGRVVVDLSDPQVGVDIRQQGETVVVDFLKTRVPDSLKRKLDVGDFGTPVRNITTIQNGDNVRMTIQPSGLWEHNAYQSETQFVVEVKPVKEDPGKLFQGTRAGYRGEKLSLNFQNVDVRALLQVIADFTNLNIITSDSVTGALTLRLKDVPWDQALDIILQTKGLDMRKNGNVLWIAPRDELATKEKLDLESKQQIAELEPLRTESFQLNYQKADALVKLLSDEKQKVLSKRGSAVSDARTNQVFVQDVPSRLEEVRRLIAKIDIPVRQVLIEARIVEADDRFSRNLGAKLGWNDKRGTVYSTIAVRDPVTGQNVAVNVPTYGTGNQIAGGTYGTIAGNLNGVADLSSQNGTNIAGTNANGLARPTDINNTLFVNLPAAPISGVAAGQFAISLFGNKLSQFLNLEISALEADQRGKVVSSPRVLTADQGKALIEQGTELPFQTATSSGATAITFRKANLKLEVTPQITPEGNVILDVDVNRDAVGQLTPSGFAIDTRHVKTQVLVENGGTVVIGGIYEQFERVRTNKVPLLGDIPYLGFFFRNQQRTSDKTELLVFLTPRVVTDSTLVR